MTTAQVVETSVTVNNCPIQDYIQPDDHTQPTGYLNINLRLGVFCSVKKNLNFPFVLLLWLSQIHLILHPVVLIKIYEFQLCIHCII